MDKKEVKKRVEAIWKEAKKDLDKVLKETTILVKKGEKQLKDISGKSKVQAEIISLKLQREKFYYELGKLVANSKDAKSKLGAKEIDILNKINKISLQIKKQTAKNKVKKTVKKTAKKTKK